MGYTCAGKSITMDATCYSNGVLSLNTTTTVPAISRFSASLSPVSPVVPDLVGATAHGPISHTKDTHKQNFILRGGFYKTKTAKRCLFLAGHLHKHAHTVRA